MFLHKSVDMGRSLTGALSRSWCTVAQRIPTRIRRARACRHDFLQLAKARGLRSRVVRDAPEDPNAAKALDPEDRGSGGEEPPDSGEGEAVCGAQDDIGATARYGIMSDVNAQAVATRTRDFLLCNPCFLDTLCDTTTLKCIFEVHRL